MNAIYKTITDDHRRKMNGICNNSWKYNWENPWLIDVLSGNLPKIRETSNDKEIQNEINSLEKLFNNYDACLSDKELFLNKANRLIDDIKNKNNSWRGIDKYHLNECILLQKFCLICGEGGIGKSYFIKCLEEKLHERAIEHLCIYGKFEKDLQEIDIEEIIKASSNGFVVIVDAINEMSILGQKNLFRLLNKCKRYQSIRYIITYRTNSLDNNILKEIQKLSSIEYQFPGVSYESSLEKLLQSPIPDIYRYEDILYSNNPLFLNMLSKVLLSPKLVYEKENSIASITFILEQYIKYLIEKLFEKRTFSFSPIDIWKDIKRTAEWMYHNEKREIDYSNLKRIIKSGDCFISSLTQIGIVGEYKRNNTTYVYFLIDQLTDFLIARSLFEEIRGKPITIIKSIISNKMKKFYSLSEALILVIFDNLSPHYDDIADIIQSTDLKYYFSLETVLKINFKNDWIKSFIGRYLPLFEKQNFINIFGGYSNKPFNCKNFLNDYYVSGEHQQLEELSSSLSDNCDIDKIVGRLKNILYFIILTNKRDTKKLEEAFYFSMWCTASPNDDIRNLATKLLYEIVRLSSDYINIIIDWYHKVIDPYIREAIIFVLAFQRKENQDIKVFFTDLVEQEQFLTAKSIKRMSKYFGNEYGYINWNRENFYRYNSNAVISSRMDEMLFRIDLMDKTSLPFEYKEKNNPTMYHFFINNDKSEIMKFNNLLEKDFSCVKSGICNGLFSFPEYINDKYFSNISISDLDINSFFFSYEVVLDKLFAFFQLIINENIYYHSEYAFKNSLFMKCFKLGTGLFYGSLMCNYFSNSFATYNNFQNSIGYEVYDPFEFFEEFPITTPIPNYLSNLESMGDIIMNRLEIPENKDITWCKNIELTKKNLLSLLNPITYHGLEWMMIGGCIYAQDRMEFGKQWEDYYSLWCCTSDRETITENGPRFLTIELNEYTDCLEDYISCKSKPWLCKSMNSLSRDSKIMDDIRIALPPAELIAFFNLHVNIADMSWSNEHDEKIILCNNNKYSYYKDQISETIFIRKDYWDKYLENRQIKFFSFTERYVPQIGYADETSFHFEIYNGRISKEISNKKANHYVLKNHNLSCENCKFGINKKIIADHEESEKKLLELQNLIDEIYNPPSDHK